MKKIIGILLTLLLFVTLSTSTSLAQAKKLPFDEKAAYSYIKALSCDGMQGRKSGHPGAVKSEEYIAAKYKEWGIEPAGDPGSYFQNFTIAYRNVGVGAALEIWTDKLQRDFYYGEDWRVQSYSGSGNFVAEIVFVGYGIHAPEKGYDEYAGLDIKGKLVLFTSDTPARFAVKLEEEAKMDNRIKAAKKLGARGVIGFKPPTSQSRYFRLRVSKEVYDPHFVILSAEPKVTDFIFKELLTDLRFPFSEIGRTGKPHSFATGVKAFISVNAEYDPERATRNVLAKITGSDPKLKNEYVVIGGHMDHLGISPRGDVYNGANDNASGTAVAMEIARTLKANKVKLKRTVVFAGWAAEEQGLLGSYHYCDHATHPIEKTVTYFNMDMVAHGGEKVRFSGEYYGPHVWEILKAKLPKSIMDNALSSRGGPGGSDHSPFLAKGVPAFGVGSPGHHFKYHHVRDDIELVKPEVLKIIGDAVYAAVVVMANAEEEFIQPRRQANYNLKYQNLVNFKPAKLANVVEHRKDVKNEHVDLQLAFIEEKEGLNGEALRVDIINGLFAAADKLKKARGLQGFTSSSGLSNAVRNGKTTIMPGLKGLKAIQDDLQWAGVLAKQRVYFIIADDLATLFEGDAVSENGKAVIKAVNKGGLLLLTQPENDAQTAALLQAATKPMLIMAKNVPGQEVLDLVKKKEAAVGLILAKDADIATYFEQLDKVKEAIGSQYVMIVNENCLWKEAGKGQMLDLISDILKADYGRYDFSNVLSGTFLRLVTAVRIVLNPPTISTGR